MKQEELIPLRVEVYKQLGVKFPTARLEDVQAVYAVGVVGRNIKVLWTHEGIIVEAWTDAGLARTLTGNLSAFSKAMVSSITEDLITAYKKVPANV